jgi:diguanylate cyclase (GGDEF)-like protein
MDEFFKSQPEDVSIGIVYCDVMGLKVVNDTMGHQAGDELLLRACRCLKNVFYQYSLFRIGGDEFLVLCSGIDSETLEKKVAKLKERLHEDHAMMAVGSVWRPDSSENMDKLLMEADSHMYEDKRGYYEKNNRDRRRGS